MYRSVYHVLGLIFLLSISIPVSASSVVFQIIQHDKTQTEIRQASNVIETALFDFFFDKGFIVSNSRSISTEDDTSDKEIIYAALGEASGGNCAFMATVVIDYDTSKSFNPEATVLSNIKQVSWSIYDVYEGNLVGSGSRSPGVVNAKRDNENGILNFTKQIAGDMLILISKKR